MTTTTDVSVLGLDQSSVNKFLANFLDRIKHSSQNMTYEATIDLMSEAYRSTGTDSSIVEVIRALKHDRSIRKSWDDTHKLVTEGNGGLFAPTRSNEPKNARQVLNDTHFPKFDSLDDWSNYISGAGTSLGGWMTGGPKDILSTTDSAISAALEKRFSPRSTYRRIKSYASEQTLVKTNIPTGTNPVESRLRGIEQLNAESAEALNSRSLGARRAYNALHNVSRGVSAVGSGISLGQGGIDLYSGINQNDGTRIAGGAIALTGGLVSVGDSVAKRVSSSYKAAAAVRAAGLGADIGRGGSKAAHFAPVAGGLIAVAAGIVSVAKNSRAADESFATGNWGRGAMFTTMATLDSVAVVVDIVGTVADFIPGVGTIVSVVCDIASTIIGAVSDLIGAFTELVDTRSDDQKVRDAFDKYLQSSAFTGYIDKLAEEFKTQGFDVFVYMTDAESAKVDADGVDLKAHNTKMARVRRDLTSKVAGVTDKMRRQVKLDATGQSNIISGGDADDLLQVVRDDEYLAEASKILKGLGGDDRIVGGHGPDTIIGGAGNDKLYGRSGPDYLFGGSGGDYLKPGPDARTAVGGLGNDVVVLNEPDTHYDGGLRGTGIDTLMIPGSIVPEDHPGRMIIAYRPSTMKIEIRSIWPGSYATSPYGKAYKSIHGFEKVYVETKGRFSRIDLEQDRSLVGLVAEKTSTLIDFDGGADHARRGKSIYVAAELAEGTHILQFADLGNGVRGRLFGYAEHGYHALTIVSDTPTHRTIFLDSDDSANYNRYQGNNAVSIFRLGKVDAISLMNSSEAEFLYNPAGREFDLSKLSSTSPAVIVGLSSGTVKLQQKSFCNALLSLDRFSDLQAMHHPLRLVFGAGKSNLLDLSRTTKHPLAIDVGSNNVKLEGTNTVCATFGNVANFNLGPGRHSVFSPTDDVNVTLNGGSHKVGVAQFSKISSYAGEHEVALESHSILAMAASGDTIGKIVALDLDILKPATSDRLKLSDYVIKIDGTPLTEHSKPTQGAADTISFSLDKEGYASVENVMIHHESDASGLEQVKAAMLNKDYTLDTNVYPPNRASGGKDQGLLRYYRRAANLVSFHDRCLRFSLSHVDALIRSVTDYQDNHDYRQYSFKVLFYKKSRNTVKLSGQGCRGSALELIGVDGLSDFRVAYDKTAHVLNIYCQSPDQHTHGISYNKTDEPLVTYHVDSPDVQSAIEAFCAHFSTVVIDRDGTGERRKSYDVEAFKSALHYLSETTNRDLGLSSSLFTSFPKRFPPGNTITFFIDGVNEAKVFDSRVDHTVDATGDREYIDRLPSDRSGMTCHLDFSSSGKCIAWIDASKQNQWHVHSSTRGSTGLGVLVLAGVAPARMRVQSTGGSPETHVFSAGPASKIHWHGRKPDIVYFQDTKRLYTGRRGDNPYTAPHGPAGRRGPVISLSPKDLIVDKHVLYEEYSGWSGQYPQAKHVVFIERHPRQGSFFSVVYTPNTPGPIVAGWQTNVMVGLPKIVSGRTYRVTVHGTYDRRDFGRSGVATAFYLAVGAPGGFGIYGSMLKQVRNAQDESTITELEVTVDSNPDNKPVVLTINSVERALTLSGLTIVEI